MSNRPSSTSTPPRRRPRSSSPSGCVQSLVLSLSSLPVCRTLIFTVWDVGTLCARPLQDLEAEIAKIKLQFPRLQQQIQSEQTERTRLVAEEEEARRQVETLQQEMQNLQGALQRLQHAQGAGPLAPYGQNMQAVVNEINRRKWVGRKPLGPLGLHVKLKDMKWKRLVEANLGNMMHSWAVTSGEDVRQLRDVFNQCRQRYKT